MPAYSAFHSAMDRHAAFLADMTNVPIEDSTWQGDFIPYFADKHAYTIDNANNIVIRDAERYSNSKGKAVEIVIDIFKDDEPTLLTHDTPGSFSKYNVNLYEETDNGYYIFVEPDTPVIIVNIEFVEAANSYISELCRLTGEQITLQAQLDLLEEWGVTRELTSDEIQNLIPIFEQVMPNTSQYAF